MKKVMITYHKSLRLFHFVFLIFPIKSYQIISKVNSIHYSIKEQIELEKKQNIEVSSFLKDTIDNIEALTLALNYDYITEYHGNKYSLMEFLVFKLKIQL